MSLLQSLYGHFFHKNHIYLRGIAYNPCPRAQGWGVLTPNVLLFDLRTILNRMAISKLLSDKFCKKTASVGGGRVVVFRSLPTPKKGTITSDFQSNEPLPKYIRHSLPYELPLKKKLITIKH